MVCQGNRIEFSNGIVTLQDDGGILPGDCRPGFYLQGHGNHPLDKIAREAANSSIADLKSSECLGRARDDRQSANDKEWAPRVKTKELC
jgi:hypothetical protein